MGVQPDPDPGVREKRHKDSLRRAEVKVPPPPPPFLCPYDTRQDKANSGPGASWTEAVHGQCCLSSFVVRASRRVWAEKSPGF